MSIYMPTWEDINRRRDKGEELSPLDEFIYSQEPSGVDPSKEFTDKLRLALQSVLDGQRG